MAITIKLETDASQTKQTLRSVKDDVKVAKEEAHQLGKEMEVVVSELGQANLKAVELGKAYNTISMGFDKKSGKMLSADGPLISDKQAAAFGAAALGAAATAAAIAHVADEYIELNNAALKFVDSGRNATRILEDQRELADDLHIGLKETLGAYDAVRDATDELNLTYEQQIRLTKTLGEAAQMSGKSTESLAEMLHNIKVAMETGQDPGRAMVTLFKQYPDLADHLTESLGKTRAEIKQMAKDGQLSFRDLANAVISNTDQIDKKFGQRAVTWGHNWETLRDSLEKPFNVVDQLNAFANVDLAIQRVVVDTKKLADQWADLERERAEKMAKGFLAAGQDIVGMLGEMSHQIGGMTNQISENAKAWRAVKQEISEIDKLKNALSWQNSSTGIQEIVRRTKEAKEKAAKEAADAQEAAEKRAYDASVEMMNARIQAEEEWKKAVLKNEAEAAAARKKHAEEEKAAAQKTQEAWANGLGVISRKFVDTALSGKMSFREMTEEMLKEIALLALKMAAMKMIAGGGTGALGGQFLMGLLGGANGFDYTVPSQKLALPGYASGGSFTVGGNGGTDTTLVAFRATPGETVRVRTPQQEASMGRKGGQSSGQTTVINNVFDHRALLPVLRTNEGRNEVLNIIRENPGAVRSAVNRSSR